MDWLSFLFILSSLTYLLNMYVVDTFVLRRTKQQIINRDSFATHSLALDWAPEKSN